MTPMNERSSRRRQLYLTAHNIKRDRYSYPRWDSNPQSQEASGRRPPLRPLGCWDRCTLLYLLSLGQETFRLQLIWYGFDKEKVHKKECGDATYYFFILFYIFIYLFIYLFAHLSDGEKLKYGF
jgi:hypothetical protein